MSATRHLGELAHALRRQFIMHLWFFGAAFFLVAAASLLALPDMPSTNA